MGEKLQDRGTGDAAGATVTNDEFRLLADNLPTLAWMANADGHIFWYNRRWHEYCGTAPEQMEGWGWQSVHDPVVLPEVLSRWRAALATGTPFEMTFPLRGADGVFRPFLTRIQPVRNEAGQVMRWFGTNTDISAQAAAEERLRELVGTLDLAAVMVRALDGTILFWSQGCERLYGWTAEEALGRSAHELLRTEYPVPRAEVEAALLRDDRWRGDLGHVRRDGTPIVVAAYKALRRDERGQPAAVMESLANVTALRQTRAELERLNAELETRVEARTAELIAAEASLRQAQKMEAVGQLTGGIAHDFNNMLQVISGSLEMVQRRVAQGRATEAARFAGDARRTVERASALTHRLLAFARRQALQPERVEPDELVQGIVELIRRTVGPEIRVETRLHDGVWSVLCDPNQLENVLLNLAINARDAMPEGGALILNTADVRLSEADVAGQEGAEPGDYVEIAVTDTGTGMDAATQARAFEPFFTTKPIGQGTGLGLSQLYGFVRQSGGVVRLESAPGQGTTVRLYLPRYADEQNSERAELVRADVPRTGVVGAVLLVEDEAEVRTLVAEALRELGCQVLEAEDGTVALRLLRLNSRVDVLVTDVGLPSGMNGRQVADAARQHTPGLPVLFITGYAGGVLDGKLAPGMEVLGKPFTLGALTAKVEAMLQAPTAA